MRSIAYGGQPGTPIIIESANFSKVNDRIVFNIKNWPAMQTNGQDGFRATLPVNAVVKQNVKFYDGAGGEIGVADLVTLVPKGQSVDFEIKEQTIEGKSGFPMYWDATIVNTLGPVETTAFDATFGGNAANNMAFIQQFEKQGEKVRIKKKPDSITKQVPISITMKEKGVLKVNNKILPATGEFIAGHVEAYPMTEEEIVIEHLDARPLTPEQECNLDPTKVWENNACRDKTAEELCKEQTGMVWYNNKCMTQADKDALILADEKATCLQDATKKWDDVKGCIDKTAEELCLEQTGMVWYDDGTGAKCMTETQRDALILAADKAACLQNSAKKWDDALGCIDKTAQDLCLEDTNKQWTTEFVGDGECLTQLQINEKKCGLDSSMKWENQTCVPIAQDLNIGSINDILTQQGGVKKVSDTKYVIDIAEANDAWMRIGDLQGKNILGPYSKLKLTRSTINFGAKPPTVTQKSDTHNLLNYPGTTLYTADQSFGGSPPQVALVVRWEVELLP